MEEVVQFVEVIEGDQMHHQGDSFEDLILTVVPDNQEGGSATTSGGGGQQQRTILVTEVHHDQAAESKKDEKINDLEARVEELENQVHFLEDELRLIRRKVKGSSSGTGTNNYAAIRRTVMEVLNKQTLKVSVSDYEDEEEYDPLARIRGTPGRTPSAKVTSAKRKYEEENGVSDNDDEDFDDSEEEEEAEVAPKRRRGGPGRPRGRGRARVNRFELTPPPVKTPRPRGRPRKYVDPVSDEHDESMNSVETEGAEKDKQETVQSKATVEEEEVEENETATVKATDDDKKEKESIADEAENVEEKNSPESQMSPPKRGRRKAAPGAAEVEPEVTPRTSSRMRRVSRKGSE